MKSKILLFDVLSSFMPLLPGKARPYLSLLFLLAMPFFSWSQVITYNRTAWTVAASSEELNGDGPVNGRANAMLDGDNATFWSSQWASGTAPYPHVLLFDMQVAQLVNQLYYVPRDYFNPCAFSGSVAFSDDGIAFGAEMPVFFSTQFAQNFINLPTVQNHRYFRITITQNYVDYQNGYNAAFVTTMAEVGTQYNPSFEATLSSFTAQSQTAGVSLSWSTAFETNSVSYTVTRSADAVNFTPIGSPVPATGTSTTATNYNFIDTAPLTGFNFYRLELASSSGPMQTSTIANSEFPLVNYTSSQPKNLNVFYFIPAGKAAYADFKSRLDTVLLSTQLYIKDEMFRNGRGNKTFGLATDSTHQKVKLIVINGKFPFAHYPYAGGGRAAQDEIDEYTATHPSAYYGSHNLVLFPTFSYDTATADVVEQVPFYGSGKNCYALDYPDLKQSLLGVAGPQGNTATTYIGGMVHELGHGLNLPHNQLKVSESTDLGTLLMSNGNYTYGNSTTSLSATDALY